MFCVSAFEVWIVLTKEVTMAIRSLMLYCMLMFRGGIWYRIWCLTLFTVIKQKLACKGTWIDLGRRIWSWRHSFRAWNAALTHTARGDGEWIGWQATWDWRAKQRDRRNEGSLWYRRIATGINYLMLLSACYLVTCKNAEPHCKEFTLMVALQNELSVWYRINYT